MWHCRPPNPVIWLFNTLKCHSAWCNSWYMSAGNCLKDSAVRTSPSSLTNWTNLTRSLGYCTLLTQPYCISTISACKVGQNIYLGIIGLQVHNVLNIQHWGKGVGVCSIRDCNGRNNFAASPSSNIVRTDKWNFSRFPLVPFAVLLLPGMRKSDVPFRCMFPPPPPFSNFTWWFVLKLVDLNDVSLSSRVREQVTSGWVFTGLNVHLG